jgi:two-component system, NarL family, sensor kinase
LAEVARPAFAQNRCAYTVFFATARPTPFAIRHSPFLMRLRTKIFLLGLAPLLVSLVLIALAVRQQERELATRQHALAEREYMQARRTELRHYVDLAVSTVQPLYARGGPGDREEALRLLSALTYGEDGYFFVYDWDGTVLMHPRQPDILGKNLWELRDPTGRPTIQALINQAKAGGGYVDYLWRKPSSTQTTAKLGYVVALERWQWMLGTGLYLDDIQATLTQLDREASSNIATTLFWIAGIAAFGVALSGSAGLVLNLSEQRVSDGKLRLLARQVVQSQEDERAHLSRELHDGVSQTLVSTKLLVESAVATQESAGHPPEPALSKALARLNASLTEVRNISHRLRPALLDTLGLPAALHHLGHELDDAGPVRVRVDVEGKLRELPEVVKTMLFRVAQESLTNIVKHAQAQQVSLLLRFAPEGGVQLQVCDDGQGFDLQAVQEDPQRGIGLRNMRERLASIGGSLQCVSRPGFGTEITAEVAVDVLQKLSMPVPRVLT